MQEFDTLLPAWDRLWRSGWRGIRGSDATYSVAWSRALQETLLQGAPVQVLALDETAPN
jgi:hypothetical protein